MKTEHSPMASVLILVSLLWLLSPLVAWPQKTPGYTFFRSDFPGALETFVTGINDRPLGRGGDVVGSYTDQKFRQHHFVFYRAYYNKLTIPGLCKDRDVAISERYTLAPTTINNARVIGGSACTQDPVTIDDDSQGFTYVGTSSEHREKRLDLIKFPGAMYTYVQGINDAGTIAGSFQSWEQTPQQGAFILKDGIYTALPPVEDYTVWATDINNHGEIVGTAYSNGGSGGGGQVAGGPVGFVFVNGEYDFFDFPHGSYGVVSGTNDHGHIVGSFWTYEYDTLDVSCCWRGFLLKDGVYTIINATKESQTIPGGINNAGLIAGSHYRPTLKTEEGEDRMWLAKGFVAVPTPAKVVKKR
jgi:hypothetical protein